MDKKQIRGLLDDLSRQGWRIAETHNGWMAFPPLDGRAVVTPVAIHKTPSDWRAWQNTLAALRRSGWRDPRREQGKE